MDKPLVNFENVQVKQKQNTIILEEVDLIIRPSELVYIYGKTGAGKTSLLRSIYSSLSVNQGKAEVLNYSLHRIKKKEIPYLRRQIGMVFQDYRLLEDRNILDNLSFVLASLGEKNKTKIKHRVDEVLTQVGLKGIETKMPNQLSGGEQQRVVIARALINSPALILADEPTGNLDQKTSEEILQLFESITKKGTAVVIATHNLTLVRNFPGTVYSVQEGKLERSSVF